MEWIVKIEEEKNQRIRVEFSPTFRRIHILGEVKTAPTKWTVFYEVTHDMRISLEQLQEQFEIVIFEMQKTLVEYENLNKGFSVLKLIGFEDED